MSSTITRCLLGTDSSLSCESRKKQSRKRHRNKSRSSHLKKKKLKKFHCRRKSSTGKSNFSKFEFIPDSKQMMANWYWSNYRKAVEWQERHRTARWKACALALLEENNYLLQIINQLHPEIHPEVSVTRNHLNEGFGSFEKLISLNQSSDSANKCDHYSNCKNINEDNDDGSDGNDGDETNDNIEFEMSEEMMKFFQESFKHKMELKEIKEKQMLHNVEDEVKQMQIKKMKRATEMNQLYGDGASMIIGMETAVQLSFEKFCDTKAPKYWPNIPFRL